jgi:UV DNA damage endonuclease
MIRKNFTVELAKKYALQNIKDIQTLLEWNENNNIKLLRISSDLFPHFTDPVCEKYDINFAENTLYEVGSWAKKHKHRITTHPGQYVQIGAKSRDVYDKSVEDLKMHADFLDAMCMDNSSILCVHGGGIYGDKENTIRRWIDQFDELPTNVKDRLALENCEKCYNVRDCLTIAQECKIPVIYDCHHYDCFSILHSEEKQEVIDELMPEIIESWGCRIPLFHVSEQAPDKRIGAHSNYITKIPDHMFLPVWKYNRKVDIEVEAKCKEKAILKLYKDYPYLIPI